MRTPEMRSTMTGPAPLQHSRYYHIYNRGNNRENIFIEERNYRYFLKLYAKYIGPIADTYAYCQKTLRVSETLRVSGAFTPLVPSQQFGNLFNAYAKAINKAYQRTGSLFEHPFGRIPVTSDAYFVYLITYIHQNPQKHGFVDDFRLWPYSSYHTILSTKPTRLKRSEVLAWFDGPTEFQASHQQVVNEYQIASLVPDDFD